MVTSVCPGSILLTYILSPIPRRLISFYPHPIIHQPKATHPNAIAYARVEIIPPPSFIPSPSPPPQLNQLLFFLASFLACVCPPISNFPPPTTHPELQHIPTAPYNRDTPGKSRCTSRDPLRCDSGTECSCSQPPGTDQSTRCRPCWCVVSTVCTTLKTRIAYLRPSVRHVSL